MSQVYFLFYKAKILIFYVFICITYSGNLEHILNKLFNRGLNPSKYRGFILVDVRNLRQAMRLYSIEGVANVYNPSTCRHGKIQYDPVGKYVIKEEKGLLLISRHSKCPICGSSLKKFRIKRKKEYINI